MTWMLLWKCQVESSAPNENEDKSRLDKSESADAGEAWQLARGNLKTC